MGLDIGSQTITLVQLKSKQGRWQLHHCGMKSLPLLTNEEDGVEGELALEDALRGLVQESHIHQTHVACSIRGPSVMVKSIQVPMMTATELEEHLEWEMDQYIPADVSEIYWDYHIPNTCYQEDSKAMMSVLLVAARKKAVHKRTELLQRVGLDPMVMDVDVLALCNMYAFNYEDRGPKGALLINMSPCGVGMVVLSEGDPIYMREFEVGGEGFRDLLEQRFGNPLTERLDDDATNCSESQEVWLKEVYREVSREVKKTIEYCCDLSSPHQIEKLFLCGGYAGLPGLARTVEAEVNIPLEFISPFQKLEVLSGWKSRESLQRFGLLAGVAIGLAVRGIDDR